MTGNATEGDPPSLDSALDPAPIQRLLTTLEEDGPALVIGVITTFFDEAPRLVGEIRQALNSERVADVGKTAHSLKSSAGALGAVRLSDACARLEACARADDMAAVAELVRQVEVEHEAARLALHSAVVALRSGAWER